MSRKPTDPRPDRRYVPVAIDTALDRIRSASAVIALPGFAFLPGNLDALFAEAVRELRARARTASPQSQAAPRIDGSPILPDQTVLAPETSGGFRPWARRSEIHKALTPSRHPRSRRSHLQASTRARKGFGPPRRPAPARVAARFRAGAVAAVRWGGLSLLPAALSRSMGNPGPQAFSARGSLRVRGERPPGAQ